MLFDPKWEAQTPAKPIEPWRQVLLDAAKLLETDGHCKHVLYRYGKRCALGAIFESDERGPGKYTPAHSLAVFHLFVRIGGSIADWNNAPERTAGEVIATMRDVAHS